jgi:prepilin-type processing-associated H-X9-DG protein
VVIAIIGVLIALLLPAVQQAREAARRASCKSNLRQIGLALHNYQSTHRVFPPGVLGNSGSVSQNQLLHTWPTMILPFVEQKPLYDSYDFNVRFDHANNAAAVRTKVPVYVCPSFGESPEGGQYGAGHYAGNAGTMPGQNDGLLFPLSRVAFRDVTDGTSNTIAVGEFVFEIGGWARGAMNLGGGGGGGGGGGSGGGGGQGFARGVLRWWRCAANCAQPGMNPDNTACSGSCERQFQFSSRHVGGAHFGFADGHARFLSENIDVELYRSLLTRAGGEVLGEY